MNLRTKMERAGGSCREIGTVKRRPSQYDHRTRKHVEPPLSQRWNTVTPANGLSAAVHRDLYSAFLILNANRIPDGFSRTVCTKTFPRCLKAHDGAQNGAHNRTTEDLRITSGWTVSSVGIRKAIEP